MQYKYVPSRQVKNETLVSDNDLLFNLLDLSLAHKGNAYEGLKGEVFIRIDMLPSVTPEVLEKLFPEALETQGPTKIASVILKTPECVASNDIGLYDESERKWASEQDCDYLIVSVTPTDDPRTRVAP